MDIKRRRFIQNALAAAAVLHSGPTEAFPKRPNVLVVICDQWRAQALGFRGDVNAHTRTIDRFAKESIDFEQAVSGTPVCSAARASLMTGQYCLTNGVYLNDVELKPRGRTLAEVFAAAGYQTGYIGKWHLHGSPGGSYERRLAFIPKESRFGFDYWKAAECTHDYMHSIYYQGDDPTPRYWEGYDAIAQTSDARAFVRERSKRTDPYFLVLSYGPPHFPYMAPPPYHDRWEKATIQLRPNVLPAARKQAKRQLRGYYAAIELLDDCFESLLREVAESGAADDTVVLFMSDHGEMGYSQGLVDKQVPWEESVRIQFLLRYPRKFGRKGIRSNALLNMPDVMPTLLGLCGMPIPKEVEGFDWSGHVSGNSESVPRSAFLCMPAASATMRVEGLAEYRGVRTGRHTYVRTLNGPWLLYDNERDPHQMKNLVHLPGAQRLQRELDKELESWLEKRRDAFLPGGSYLVRDRLTGYQETKMPIGESESPWGDWKSTLKRQD